MDENALTQEITRIMGRRSRAPNQSPAPTPTPMRWLGDEADRALVEGYEMTAGPMTDIRAPGGVDAGENIGSDATTAQDETPPSNFTAGNATQWVRQARRDRFRRKVRNAAGWTVSLTVSVLLVATVGFAMYGWPNGSTAIRQIELKSLKVSAARQPGHEVPAYASGATAWQKQLATAEPEATR